MERRVRNYVIIDKQKHKLANHSKKSRTPLVEIRLFYLEIPRIPFVLGKISYAICKSELPLDL